VTSFPSVAVEEVRKTTAAEGINVTNAEVTGVVAVSRVNVPMAEPVEKFFENTSGIFNLL
jgi:hypothetical protein